MAKREAVHPRVAVKSSTKKASPKRPAKAAPKRSSRSGVPRRPPSRGTGLPRKRTLTRVAPATAPVAAAGLSDEEQILAAKYLPRDLPPRLFEEERFLFPESYRVNRVRLLVKDPDWIFAYWDVDPKSLDKMKKSLGERSMALARLTLRISDPNNGGSTDVLLPAGARWWYVRADSASRSYRAELGVVLPSGKFHGLAQSNVVTTPRVGPSAAAARRRIAYRRAGSVSELGVAVESPEDEMRSEGVSGLGPWESAPVDGAGRGPESSSARTASRGGASDVFRPGGASDTHRR